MKKINHTFAAMVVLCCLGLLIPSAAMAEDMTPKAVFDYDRFPDMSDFDPNNPVEPGGDTIKIAIVASFSGPAASVGEIYYACVAWAAHTINKQGGLMVDGKKKMVEVIKADGQSKPDVTKKVTERMILKEKVDFLWGTNGSHLMKVINQVAKRYKKIAICASSLSDELYDKQNFTKYSFMTSYSTEQIGRTAAYYYGQVRKKERKFYILCQDYLFGHSMAAGFKKGLQEYYPDAEIVGEDYHRLFLTDFAPYLTKIKSSGAEVIYTGDWIPDAANLLKQARQMGIMLPFVDIFMNEPRFLTEVGIEGTKGLIKHRPVRHRQSFLQKRRPDKVLQGMAQFAHQMEGAIRHRALHPFLGKYRGLHYIGLLAVERRGARGQHRSGQDHQGLGRRRLPGTVR